MLHSDKENFRNNAKKICVDTDAELINSIGNILTLYKKNSNDRKE